MEKLSTQHVILYAKHWYAHSDYWSDLRKCLTCDGYSGEFFSNSDILQKILGEVEKLNNPSVGLSSFYREIQENQCWTYGYYTNKNTAYLQHKSEETYDQDLAVLRWALSKLSNTENLNWQPLRPDFDKCLPMNANISIESLERIFKDIK